MKTLKSLMLGAMALSLFSCSSDDPGINPAESSQGDVFANISLALPTRSATDDWDGNDNSVAGYEVGQDSENAVR